MNSPPNAHILSTCFWIVFGDRSDAARFSRNGRNRVSNCSPGGRSFSNPIHERGQPLRSRQQCSRSWRGAVARFILVVLAAAIFHFMLQLITILNRCHRFRGFVYQQASFSPDHKSIEIAVRPRKGSAAICCVAISRRLVTISSPKGDSSSFLSGDFWFFCSTPCGALIAAAARRSSSRKFRGATASVP